MVIFRTSSFDDVDIVIKIGYNAVGSFTLARVSPTGTWDAGPAPQEAAPSGIATFKLRDPFLDARNRPGQSYRTFVQASAIGSGAISVSLKVTQNGVGLQALDTGPSPINGAPGGPFGAVLLRSIQGSVGEDYNFSLIFGVP